MRTYYYLIGFTRDISQYLCSLWRYETQREHNKSNLFAFSKLML